MSLIAAVYNAVIGMRKRTWASGMTVKKGEIVKSPADNEDYERITATGGGTTDPADDVTNYVARSYKRVTSLSKGRSFTMPNYGGAAGPVGATAATMGAVSPGTRTLALSITGRGTIQYLLAAKAESGSMRVEILIDGRTVLDETAAFSSGIGFLYVGAPMYVATASDSSVHKALPELGGPQFRRSLHVYLTPIGTASYSSSGVAYIVGGEA